MLVTRLEEDTDVLVKKSVVEEGSVKPSACKANVARKLNGRHWALWVLPAGLSTDVRATLLMAPRDARHSAKAFT